MISQENVVVAPRLKIPASHTRGCGFETYERATTSTNVTVCELYYVLSPYKKAL